MIRVMIPTASPCSMSRWVTADVRSKPFDSLLQWLGRGVIGSGSKL